MADFYNGFVFEEKVSGRLTIEGNPVPYKHPRGEPYEAKLPSGDIIKAGTVREIVGEYLKQSDALKRRNQLAKEHVRELTKGRPSWNRWRRENPHIKPVLACQDLRGVKVKGGTLAGYDFSYTNLCQAKMQGFIWNAPTSIKQSLRGRTFPEPTLSARTFAEPTCMKRISKMRISTTPTYRAFRWSGPNLPVRC